ncbi:hypothetical protein AB0K43_12975 [Kitasatospora sp. NPDC049258]|uniref:hypothetical protein n=1 Tax=Kitasatospora sp. NPDC049258 TaxID=3155394 RepID=UPI003445609C
MDADNRDAGFAAEAVESAQDVGGVEPAAVAVADQAVSGGGVGAAEGVGARRWAIAAVARSDRATRLRLERVLGSVKTSSVLSMAESVQRMYLS